MTINDPYFKKFIKMKNLSKSTELNYSNVIKYFTEANNITFTDFIKKIKSQQYDYIQDNRIIRYDPEFSDISVYLDTFIETVQKNGASNITINGYLTKLKAILNFFDIQLPRFPELADDTRDWYPLTKEEIKYIISISDITYKAIILFLTTTGVRRTDLVNFTIEDFMKATNDYHNYTNVYEFIDHAPQGMIPFFDFYPQKTKRHNIECKVCCTPECSDMVLLMLRERKQTMKKLYPELTIKKEDKLFSTKRKHYKESMKPSTVTNVFYHKQIKLMQERRRVLDYKMINNEISKEVHDSLLHEEPRFSPHALRKYFITTVAENVGNLRVCALMEGHAPPMGLDRNYVRISDELVKNEYLKVIPPLSFKDVKVDFLTSKRKKELEDEIRELKEENHEIRKNIHDEAKKAVNDLLYEYFPEKKVNKF